MMVAVPGLDFMFEVFLNLRVSNKPKITFFEYILLIWLISIQIERMKKFAAMANKPRAEKIKLLKKDKWNAVYLLAFLTCLGMI